MRGNKTEGIFADVARNWFLTEYVHQLKGKEIIMALALSSTVKDIHLNNLVLQMDKGREIQRRLFVPKFCNFKGRKIITVLEKKEKIYYLDV